jgi:hypothetical protein
VLVLCDHRVVHEHALARSTVCVGVCIETSARATQPDYCVPISLPLSTVLIHPSIHL